jgi:hypothetical protein
VKNADTAQAKGYDAGKKVSGIKRHLAMDTQGLPHAIEVTTANVNDREAAVLMLLLNADTLSEVVRILVDGGYTGEPFSRRVAMILGAAVELRSALSLTASPSFRSAGWSSARSLGSTRAGGYGKTANADCIQASKWLCWPLSASCYGDFQHVLSKMI